MNAPVVLVVDDEPGMLRAIARVLAPEYEVLIAGGPREALEMARRRSPDVAVIDIRMPDIDGFELTIQLRAIVPWCEVVLVTGSSGDDDLLQNRALKQRAFFIQKPFSREVLSALVSRCVEIGGIAAENQRYSRQLEVDLADARLIHERLLPGREAAFAGVSVAARQRTSAALTGDFFDYAPLDDRGLAVVIADVNRRGIYGAMLSSAVKNAFWSAKGDDYDPLSVIQRIASALVLFPPGAPITACSVRILVNDNIVEYTNAGHTAPILWAHDRDVETLSIVGSAMTPPATDSVWQKDRRTWSQGHSLMLYSDGVLQPRGGSLTEFGEDTLRGVLRGQEAQGEPLLRSLFSRLDRISTTDELANDQTLVTITARL